MAELLITRTCKTHVAHGGVVELTCFDEATLQLMAVLTEFAPVEDLTRITREWLDQENNGNAVVIFDDMEGEEFFISFAA